MVFPKGTGLVSSSFSKHVLSPCGIWNPVWELLPAVFVPRYKGHVTLLKGKAFTRCMLLAGTLLTVKGNAIFMNVCKFWTLKIIFSQKIFTK